MNNMQNVKKDNCAINNRMGTEIPWINSNRKEMISITMYSQLQYINIFGCERFFLYQLKMCALPRALNKCEYSSWK